MKELFRKHGKIIMTIISIGLMLSFAMMGSNTKSRDEQRKTAAGYLDGAKVTMDEIDGYKSDLGLLRTMRMLEYYGMTWVELGSGDESQAGMYWYVLSQEASRYTMVNLSQEEAYRMADAAVKALARNKSELFDVDVKLEELKTNRARLVEAVSRMFTVIHYVNFLQTFAQPISMKELLADRELRHVQVNYVPVDAVRDWAKIPAEQITAEQVTAQFELYKNVIRTPILPPEYPPYLLDINVDADGKYALFGYPGYVDEAVTVRVGKKVPWDGSTIKRILYQGEAFKDDQGRIQSSPMTCVQLSGGGRQFQTLLTPGYDLHGNGLPKLPAEINGHRYPFGYKLPDRVKVEYLLFPRAPLRGRLEATAADVEAAIRAFKDDPYKFRERPAAPAAAAANSLAVAAPGATQPATEPATQAASKPATRSAQEILADWDDPAVKAPYINEQLDLRATALLRKLVEQARTKADMPWRATTPERANWVDYQKLAEGFEKDTTLGTGRIPGWQRWMRGLGFGSYTPVRGTTGTAFLSAGELLNLPGIGHGISTTTQGIIYDFPTLATNILELAKPGIVERLTKDLGHAPTDEDILREARTQPLGRMGLQLGHECPEVTDPEGNMYLFRVTECEPSRVPESENEVRGQVVEDCRKLAAYNKTLSAIQEALPKTGDLEAVAQQYQSRVRNPKDFNRDENTAPVEVMLIRDFVKTAFALPDPAGAKAPSTATLANENLLKIYPMKAIRMLPTNGEDFKAQLDTGFFNRQQDPAVANFVRQYLQIEAIAGRIKFTLPSGTKWPKKGGAP